MVFADREGRPFSAFKSPGSGPFSAGNVQRILSEISQTREEFRTAYRANQSQDSRLKPYHFNPLFDRPIIIIGGAYYAPIPALIPLWAMENIYYRLLKHHRQGWFTNAFGKAFEGFVASLLDAAGAVYTRERTVQIGRDLRRSADFVLVDEASAFIFDCKTHRFGLPARYGSQEAIDTELADIAKAVMQAMRTKEYIQGKLPEFSDLWRLSDFVYGAVTLDDYYLLNAPAMASRVEYIMGCGVQYQGMSVHELEYILANLEGASLVRLVFEKAADVDKREWPLGNYFCSWAEEHGVTPICDPAYNRLMALMTEITEDIR